MEMMYPIPTRRSDSFVRSTSHHHPLHSRGRTVAVKDVTETVETSRMDMRFITVQRPVVAIVTPGKAHLFRGQFATAHTSHADLQMILQISKRNFHSSSEVFCRHLQRLRLEDQTATTTQTHFVSGRFTHSIRHSRSLRPRMNPSRRFTQSSLNSSSIVSFEHPISHRSYLLRCAPQGRTSGIMDSDSKRVTRVPEVRRWRPIRFSNPIPSTLEISCVRSRRVQMDNSEIS